MQQAEINLRSFTTGIGSTTSLTEDSLSTFRLKEASEVVHHGDVTNNSIKKVGQAGSFVARHKKGLLGSTVRVSSGTVRVEVPIQLFVTN